MTCPRPVTRALCLVLAWACLQCGVASLAGAEAPRTLFSIAGGDAALTLRQLSRQARESVVFPIDLVRGVRTNPVQGEYTAREAAEHMVAGTDLFVSQDIQTGALTIGRRPKPQSAPLKPAPPQQAESFPMKNRTLLALLASWLAAGATVDAQTPATATSVRHDEPIYLNPFLVESDRADSYNAINTNSITRFRTELKTIPISADIYTESFMQDLAVTDVESMLEQYSPAGFGGANPSASGQGLGQAGDYNAQSTTVLRGLATGENLTRRNGFLPHWGPNDNYYMERVEVIRGPQAVLYGAGGAGGVVNNVAKQARFGAAIGSAEFRADQYGSLRATADYGRSFGPLAMRLAVLHDDSKYSRDFAGQKQDALYLQLAFRINPQHILRVSADRLLNQSIGSQPNLSLRAAAAGGLPADPRNTQNFRLLLAQGQAGDLVNGRLTWDNVDSFAGEFAQRKFVNQHLEVIWEGKWNSWLSTQISSGYDDIKQRTAISPTILAAPGRSGNPTGDWAVQYTNFGDSRWTQYNKGVRAVATAEFDWLRGRHQWIVGGENNLPNAQANQFRYYEVDSSGKTIVNPAQAANTNLGRNLLSSAQIGNDGWVPVGAGPVEKPFARTTGWYPFQERMVVGGKTYVRELSGIEWVVPPTRDNPRGVGGTGGQFRDAQREAFFVAGMSAWLDRRLNVLYGLRYDAWDDRSVLLCRSPGHAQQGRQCLLQPGGQLPTAPRPARVLRLFRLLQDQPHQPRAGRLGQPADLHWQRPRNWPQVRSAGGPRVRLARLL